MNEVIINDYSSLSQTGLLPPGGAFITKVFFGIGWVLPIQVDGTDGIRARSGEEGIREAVGIVLATRPGERVAARIRLGH